jgi:hypothetical protein
MNIRLFNRIAQALKQQFPNASHESLIEQARQMYEIEMQRRSKLSPLEKARVEAEDILDF